MSLDVLLADERAAARKQGRKEGRIEGRKEGRRQGKFEAQIIGVKNFVKSVSELNPSNEWILSKLIKDYGKDFSESELKKLMLEAEQE